MPDDDKTLRTVAEIVRLLDGLPLALALTAARVRALGVERLAIFRGFRAIALHTRGEPSDEEYAEAITRCDATGAVLYGGLFRAWRAMLQIGQGDADTAQTGIRTLDLLRGTAMWEMPRKLLQLMRASIDLAEARRADLGAAQQHLARAARRLQEPRAHDNRRMIQLRLVSRVLERELQGALPSPPKQGIGVGWHGTAIHVDGRAESLENHPTLAALLWHLALARLLEPGTPTDTDTLRAIRELDGRRVDVAAGLTIEGAEVERAE